MKRTKRVFSSAFKAEVALEAIKGVKTVSELAQEYELHPAGRIVLLVILKETKTTSADTRLYTRLGKHIKHTACFNQMDSSLDSVNE